MAALMDTQRKKAVIEFLFSEGKNVANIHRRLDNVYRGNNRCKEMGHSSS